MKEKKAGKKTLWEKITGEIEGRRNTESFRKKKDTKKSNRYNYTQIH